MCGVGWWWGRGGGAGGRTCCHTCSESLLERILADFASSCAFLKASSACAIATCSSHVCEIERQRGGQAERQRGESTLVGSDTVPFMNRARSPPAKVILPLSSFSASSSRNETRIVSIAVS